MRGLIIILCAPLLFFLFSNAHQQHAVKKEDKEIPANIVYPEVVKIHPPAIHFGVSLPVIAVLFEAYYLLRRRKPDAGELAIIILASGAVIASAVTGLIAHNSIEDLPIKEKALEILHTHESLGLYLAGLFALIALLRFIYIFKSSGILRALYLLLLVAGTVGILIQGNLGGQLVYDFGIGTNR